MIQTSVMTELRDRACRICGKRAALSVCVDCVVSDYDRTINLKRKGKK